MVAYLDVYADTSPMMTGDEDHTPPRGRSLSKWARWTLFGLVFAGVAAGFYFNFGRLFERLFE